MHFLFPSLFYFWAALVVVPVILYLFRPRPKTVRTSTLPFFKWLAREHQDTTWLKRLKYLLSLLFCILLILLAASALGRLVAAPGADEVKTLVVMIDRSASMAAVDGDVSRIDAAKRLVKNRLAGVPAGVGVVVLAYDNRPEVLLSRSYDMRQVQRAVAAVEVRPVSGNLAPARHLARRLASLATPGAIWHVTDGGAAPVSATETDETPAADESGAEIQTEELLVAASDATNVGITALELRRLPLQPDQFEAFVQVHASGKEPVDTELELKLDGELVGFRKLTIEPGGKNAFSISVASTHDRERMLALRLVKQNDRLPLDDVAYARVPRFRPLRVLWITASPDPFTELALSSLAGDGVLEMLQGKPSAWPPEEAADVVLFDGWLPKQWPAEAAIVVMNPPGPLGPLQAAPLERGLPLESVRAVDVDHPLLFGVATGRIAVTQTAVVDGGGLLHPLWVGREGPVLLAGETAGQRVVVLGFSPERSEQLPLMASYPLLVGNALYWTAQPRLDRAGGMNRRTGDVVQLKADSIIWKSPDETLALRGPTVELDRIGFWRAPDGPSGSASLLSAGETLLPAAETAGEDTESEFASSPLGGDLTPWVMWLALLGLVVESWLYHRYWIF